MTKLRKTFERVEDKYTLHIDYTYYCTEGTYDLPGTESVEVSDVYIDKVRLPGEVYYDLLWRQLEDELLEDAREYFS